MKVKKHNQCKNENEKGAGEKVREKGEEEGGERGGEGKRGKGEGGELLGLKVMGPGEKWSRVCFRKVAVWIELGGVRMRMGLPIKRE